jgi:hypothetical protein
MREDTFQFLGFHWRGQFYHFVQLPFGLAPACWAFTKLTRELLGKWRSEGMRCSGYIDDSIHAARSLAAALANRVAVMHDFQQCGFLVNAKKSDPEPAHSKEYLGALVDTQAGILTVPTEKLSNLRSMIESALKPRRCKVRHIASIVGHVMSMSYSYGKLSLLMTRQLAIWQAAQQAYARSLERHAALSPNARTELNFWLTASKAFNGRKPLWPPTHIHTLVHSDAAGRSPLSFGGWGGWARLNGAYAHAAGRWPFETRACSSTFLETKAVLHVLQSLNVAGALKGQRILVRTDNMNVFYILNKAGSMVPAVQDLCLELFWYCMEHDIDVLADWIPRDANVLADALSKASESYDWQLNPREFQALSRRWGPFDVDLFASFTNHQVPKYFSHYYTPDTAGVNAFAQNWGRQCWCNPPFGLIARVLGHARACGSRMCVIVPFWPHSKWWPLLLGPPGFFLPFVHGCIVLPRVFDLYLGGAYGNAVAQRAPTWQSMALLMDFAHAALAPTQVPAL